MCVCVWGGGSLSGLGLEGEEREGRVFESSHVHPEKGK